MSDYQRITSYLYEYINGIRGENIGFIRVETREEQLKISFTLNTNKLLDPLKMYFYYYEHGKMLGILLDEASPKNHHYEYKESFKLSELFPDTKTLPDLDGILFYYNDQNYYASQWKDTPIQIHAFQPQKEIPPIVEEKTENEASSYLKLKLKDMEQYPCIPKELMDNGFLKMQVQNYGYLILDENAQSTGHTIGVPGVFSNQRNFVANLFGFPEFITVPHQEQKTGNFGYWIMTIDH